MNENKLLESIDSFEMYFKALIEKYSYLLKYFNVEESKIDYFIQNNKNKFITLLNSINRTNEKRLIKKYIDELTNDFKTLI